MADNTTHDVLVHKASIALSDDETIGQYTERLSKAFKDHLKTKQSLSDKDYVYLVEAGASWCVGCVYYDQSGPNPPKVYSRYFKAEYKREDGGKFTFSSTSEVERVTRFEPTAKAAPKRSRDNGGPIAKKATPAPAEAPPTPTQIEDVHKSAWTPKVRWDNAL